MVTERYGPAEVLREIGDRRQKKGTMELNVAAIPPKPVVRGTGNHFIITPAELVAHLNMVRGKEDWIRTIIATPRPKCARCKGVTNRKGMAQQFGPSEKVHATGLDWAKLRS